MTLSRLVLGAAVLFTGPAHALLLGGVEVPKEKVVVYLMIGHSNMAGNDARNSDGVAHPRAWNYTWSAATKTWVPAKETPGAMRNGLSTRGSGGPSMPFLKQMADANPAYHFGVVTNASLSSTCKGENPGVNTSGMDPEDNRYWKGARLYNEIVTAAKEVRDQVTLGGIVCMLGAVEATRLPDSICRSFGADLAQLAKDIRGELGMPNLPFMMGEYEMGATGQFSPSLPMPGVILAQTRLVPTLLDNAALIPSQGIPMMDDHHYAAKVGQVEFAKRIVAAIQQKGWFPPNSGASIVAPAPGRQAVLVRGGDAGIRRGAVAIFRGETPYLIDGKALSIVRKHAIEIP